MKYSILLFVALFTVGGLVAQDDTPTPPPPPEAEETKESEREDQIIFDLNHDRLLDLPSEIEQSLFSRGINIYLMYDVPIADQNFSFGIGLGFSSSNYLTNAGVSRIDTTNDQTYSSFELLADQDYKKNKLSVNYIDLPIEFRIRTNENKKGNRFKMALGAKIGRTVNVHSKFVDDNGDKTKTYVYPNVRDWRYGVTGRIGYGKVTLNGFYSLTTLFDTGNGQEVTPISLGISIIPF